MPHRHSLRAIVFTADDHATSSAGPFPGCSGASAGSFPPQADGNLIRRADGTIVVARGSSPRRFTRAEYFHPRPSAVDYDAASTGGSNLYRASPDQAPPPMRERLDAVRVRDGVTAAQVPIELVTASGSGLDPHLTPARDRPSRRRGWRKRAASAPLDCMRWSRHTSNMPLWGVFGPARVNVLLPQPGTGRRLRRGFHGRPQESLDHERPWVEHIVVESLDRPASRRRRLLEARSPRPGPATR